MLAVTVEQLAKHLGGQWVLNPVNTTSSVERIMIGGNIMDEGPTYFDRYPNQAVITRVERPDIQMASMCDKTVCIVLTGPGEPTEYIKAEAFKRGVPLIQVQTSTHETAEALNGLIDQTDARTDAKAHHFAGLVEKYSSVDYLDHLLG
jgi:BioD-like phosphotransacetylase family protein